MLQTVEKFSAFTNDANAEKHKKSCFNQAKPLEELDFPAFNGAHQGVSYAADPEAEKVFVQPLFTENLQTYVVINKGIICSGNPAGGFETDFTAGSFVVIADCLAHYARSLGSGIYRNFAR